MLVVLTTTPNTDEAERLARAIINEKLAACVQILPQMKSVFVWDGKVNAEPEHLLLIKTLEDKFDALSEFIQKNHSYDVPEIVAITADHTSDDYIKWLTEVVSGKR